MENSSSIEKYIDSFGTEGTVEEGVFSVDPEAALKKLSHVLDSPQKWVLKAVQAGVAGGAEEIFFSFENSATKVEWKGVKPFEMEEFQRALIQSVHSENKFLAELVIGLRALLGLSCFTLSSEGCLEVDLERNLELRQDKSPSVTLLVSHPEDENRNQALEAQRKYLLGEACFAPIPVRCDEQLIQLGVAEQFAQHFQRNSSDKILPFFDLELQRQESWELVDQPQVTANFHVGSWSEAPLQQPNFQGFAGGRLVTWLNYKTSVPCLEPQKSQVLYLKHGVVAHRSELLVGECQLGAVLALEAKEGKTDLTGLALNQESLSQETPPVELLQKFWGKVEKPIQVALMTAPKRVHRISPFLNVMNIIMSFVFAGMYAGFCLGVLVFLFFFEIMSIELCLGLSALTGILGFFYQLNDFRSAMNPDAEGIDVDFRQAIREFETKLKA